MLSHRTSGPLSLLLSLAFGCSSHGGTGSPPSPDGALNPPTDSGTGQTLSFTCAQFCDRLAATPGCSATICVQQCQQSIAVATRCAAQANALYTCTRTSAIACTSASDFPYTDCASPLADYGVCVGAADGGVVDVDAGPGPSTDGGGISTACRTCVFSACGSQVSACLGDAVCARCVTSSLGPECLSNAALSSLRSCGCASCASSCGALCGA